MTTAHSSTTFQRTLRHEAQTAASCLTLRWAVAPAAMGRPGRRPLTLELRLAMNQPPRLTLDARAIETPESLQHWEGELATRRVPTGPSTALIIAHAAPIAVAVFDPSRGDRPLHVSCALPAALGLKGGRYELIGGELTAS